MLSAVAVGVAQARSAPGGPVVANTVVVPATIVFEHGNRKNKPGNCSAVVFAKWKDVPGTTSAMVTYRWKTVDYHVEGSPPFSDQYEWVAKYRVPAGYHWLKVSAGWKDGPTPNDCSSYLPYFKSVYSIKASALLKYERAPECDDAVRGLKGWSDEVTKRLRVRGLSPNASEEQLGVLAERDPEFANALQQRGFWAARVKKRCT